VSVKTYPKILNSGLTLLNWDKLERHFDLESGVDKILTARVVCNQIIHSFIFTLYSEHGAGVDGFFVASDRAKDIEIYYLAIPTFAALMRRFASDEPSEVSWRVVDGLEHIEVK
jgi:hypothetical protein